MGSYDEWKPDKALVEWAQSHFKNMDTGGVWMPEESGLIYRKEDDSSWTLIMMVDNEESSRNHDRMKVLMWVAGITILDDEFKKISAPVYEMESRILETQMKRELAQSWADEDGTLLVDLGLENVWPEFVENREILMEDEKTTPIEIWAYKALNPNTGEYISIHPDDYLLLMGDDLFMRFKAEGRLYFAMSRSEIAEFADSGGPSEGEVAMVVGTRIGEDRVPPWLYGTYCRVEWPITETDVHAEYHCHDQFPGVEVV